MSVNTEQGMGMFLETLREAGVVNDRPRGLLVGESAAEATAPSLMTTLLQSVAERDADAAARRHEELGYLANVLVAGCSFNSGRFSHADAQNAVVATCNLGLENWPRQWLSASTSATLDPALPADFLLHQDLVTVFQIGWTVLYEQVGRYVPQRLVEILSDLSGDRSDVQDDLQDLSRQLRKYLNAGTPWRGRDRLDVLAILDTPTWAILLRLMDECPTMPMSLEPAAASRRILRVTDDFAFISENRQIAWVKLRQGAP